MSTFSGTITSREDLDEHLRNWNYALVKPTAYPWGWFIEEGDIACETCAFKALEEGQVESIDYFSFDQPQSSGESCGYCHEYIVEPWCANCGTEGDKHNRLMSRPSGEICLCRECYLTGLLTSKEVYMWERGYE